MSRGLARQARLSHNPGILMHRRRSAGSGRQPVIGAAEQIAQHLAEGLFAVMGPLFWLAIVLALAAVMLGIGGV